MKDISIIIVTYNSNQFIGDCLDSISGQTDNDFEVIAIDNNSKDATAELIRRRFPNIFLIESKENLGFGKAVNQGIEISIGTFIVVLNSDVILKKDFVEQFRRINTTLPQEVGIISPKIMKIDRKTIDSTGLILTRIYRFHDRGRGCLDIGQFDDKPDIFGSCAAAAIYKRQMLENIKIEGKYFDEDYFLLLEDFDISWRAHFYGWKAVFNPGIVCYHAGGISRTRTSISQYYTFRNRYLLLLKNEEKNALWKYIVFFLPYELIRLIYLLIINKYTLKAIRDMIKLYPAMVKKRNIIRGRV